MPQKSIEQILQGLMSDEADAAWGDFLEDNATPIYQVIVHFEPDPDRAADCFQFVCEQLVKNQFRRLRRFKTEGSAKFSTWLRAVIRNLCIDWHRQETGRIRPFRSIYKLSTFDQQVFQLLYERGVSTQEVLRLLVPAFPDVTEERLEESRQRIETGLTTRQRWLISSRSLLASESDFGTDHDSKLLNIPDPNADPEARAILKESYKDLTRKLKRLPNEDRLLIHLRFEQELTLDQIAKLLNFGNAQRVDRQLKQILSTLRRNAP